MSKQPLDYETPRSPAAKTASPVVRRVFALFFVLVGVGSVLLACAALWFGQNPLQSAVTMERGWVARLTDCAAHVVMALFCFVLAYLIWPGELESQDPADPPPA